ncbi:MAG: glycosidase [Syntrophomonadaceae bacterium]
MTHSNSESIFDKTIDEIAPLLKGYSNYDLVIGLPFPEDKDRVTAMLQSVDRVLQSWIGRRQLIVCVGDHRAVDTLKALKHMELKHPHIEFLLPAEINGRGTSIRAIIEISKRLEADLLLFSANMATKNGPGINEAWLESLLTPIQGHYDMVLGTLRRYLGIDSMAHMMAAPILEVFYGFRIGDPLGSIYAISHDFIEELAHEARFWNDTIRGYGIDFWLLTRAICWNKNICEVNMGGIVWPHTLEKRNRIFHDTALNIFEAIKRDAAIWLKERLVVRVADILVNSKAKRPDITEYSVDELLRNFRSGYKEYRHLLTKCEGCLEKIDEIAKLDNDRFYLDDTLWGSILFNLLKLYTFDETVDKEDILEALTAFYNGRVASYVFEMSRFNSRLEHFGAAEKGEIMVRKMEAIRQNLTDQLWDAKTDFNREWLHKSEQIKPPIVPLGYMEYVPGKPIVVPKKIVGKDRRIVQTDGIFRELRQRYHNRFDKFITEGLALSPDASADQIIAGVQGFMEQLESTLDKLLPGDLHTQNGLQQFVEKMVQLFPRNCMFTIGEDLLRSMLIRFPPINLMISRGYYKPADLIDNMDVRDAVTYANLMEGRGYVDRVIEWIISNLKPESFEWVELKPLILKEEVRMGPLTHAKISDLNRVTARITVKALEPFEGGKYPKIRYFTNLLRRLAIAEHYSRLFKLDAAERKNIGLKIRNCLLRLQRGDDFSAYNIFENYHHRSMVKRIAHLAKTLNEQGDKDTARVLHLMAETYGLCHVLENESFLTCTAWSWASYSFKGGLKVPTPVSVSVENRWFNHDFLELLYQNLGYNVEEIMQIVFRFIQTDKSSQNLLDALLPARPKDVAVVTQEITNEPSKQLQRYEKNPILEPIDNHWESRYVLNPGALRMGDRVYLFYRAVGADNISRIGLAVTDGYKVIERLPEPIFSPETPEEKMGCEDPRLIVVEDRIFMLYTAYDGNIAQIAAASMAVDDLRRGNYWAWKREGLAFKNIWDKDAILFPERIKGKYVVYHRIEPSIWVTYMNELKFPQKEKHAIIIGPRPGRMWDSLKIGAGAQPLKTKYGWLLIYHGVDYNYVYRLGVILVDLNNPQKVIYRSPNPILEPEEDYEVGLSGAWVPNVVFTCGAVPGVDKEVLEDEDEILVYYGAADTSIGVATATLADLIPERFRR